MQFFAAAASGACGVRDIWEHAWICQAVSHFDAIQWHAHACTMNFQWYLIKCIIDKACACFSTFAQLCAAWMRDVPASLSSLDFSTCSAGGLSGSKFQDLVDRAEVRQEHLHPESSGRNLLEVAAEKRPYFLYMSVPTKFYVLTCPDKKWQNICNIPESKRFEIIEDYEDYEAQDNQDSKCMPVSSVDKDPGGGRSWTIFSANKRAPTWISLLLKCWFLSAQAHARPKCRG